MDEREATLLLTEHLAGYRRRSYDDLVELLGEPQIAELTGETGTSYQVEVEVLWDGRPRGALRVIASIDDGGLRAFRPLTQDFILAPDGTFVDE